MSDHIASEGATRCPWAESVLNADYHDREWGVPQHVDVRLFEMITLEGAQAGLSWETVLRKRSAYRAAFSDFNIARIAQYDDADVERLLADPGIIRNRLKIRSTIGNAQAALRVQHEHGSLDSYLWKFVDRKPLQPGRVTLNDIPSRSLESDAMSRELKQLGFKFVGTTICYAFMQATGMVNDHLVSCFRYRECANL